MIKDKCAIVIPLYTNKLKKYEIESISSARKNFSNDDIYFVCPDGLNISNVETDNTKIIRFNEKYFKGISGYCLLCTSASFYKAFQDLGYTYILIHQTDCYTFYNALEHFMELGYDYYGSPISMKTKSSKWYGGTKVGNGGYSLRKINAMIGVCEKYGQTTMTEDVWFCVIHANELKICPVNIAKSFSTISNTIQSKTPMGCHGYIVKNSTFNKYAKLPKTIHYENNKNIVYTCITGKYDELLEPEVITNNFDYICYTDNPNLTSDVWEIRMIPNELSELSKPLINRYIKLHPHVFFEKYNLSIYVDGSILIKCDLNKFIETNNIKDNIITIPKHPDRDCIYDEAVACSHGKDTWANMKPQIDRYKEEGFPKNYGLTQNNIIVRKHNDEQCIDLMEKWWNEVRNGSHRDQLSLFYVLWKNPQIKINQIDKKTCNSQYFTWYALHNAKSNRVVQSGNSGVKNDKRLSSFLDSFSSSTSSSSKTTTTKAFSSTATVVQRQNENRTLSMTRRFIANNPKSVITQKVNVKKTRTHFL